MKNSEKPHNNEDAVRLGIMWSPGRSPVGGHTPNSARVIDAAACSRPSLTGASRDRHARAAKDLLIN
jgi:hypothetical protein